MKASQLLGRSSSTSASSSGRSGSLPSFALASKYSPTVGASMSNNPSPSSAAGDDIITISDKASLKFPHSTKAGFCKASELLPNHLSDEATTREQEDVKERDSTPISIEQERTSTSRSTSPGGALPDSTTSEQNVVVINLTSEGRPKTGLVVGGGGNFKEEPPKTTKPTGRKRKIDQAVAKTKKITYFFEK